MIVLWIVSLLIMGFTGYWIAKITYIELTEQVMAAWDSRITFFAMLYSFYIVMIYLFYILNTMF
jgi:hypothetical protein